MSARALTFNTEFADQDDTRNRTRWTMTVSFLVHAIVLLLLILVKPIVENVPVLTEITLIGPGDLDPAPAAAGPPAAARTLEPSAGVRVASDRDESFQRTPSKADFAPQPQGLSVADRMSARLASLRDNVTQPVASGAAVGAPSSMWSTPAGATGGTGSGGSSLTLSRGGGGSGPPLSLGRGGGTGYSPTLAAAGTGAPVKLDEPASAPGGDSHATRALAGAQLAGPIADRSILKYVNPIYPDWAKRDGVEGAVTLYFVVRADGTVKENILVQKTAGFGDFDDNARAALAAWRFEPLHGGRTGEQWGTITFHYRLRDA